MLEIIDWIFASGAVVDGSSVPEVSRQGGALFARQLSTLSPHRLMLVQQAAL